VATDTDGGASTGLRVRLVDFPVSLYVAAEMQWRGMLREYVLRGFGGFPQAYGPDEASRAAAAIDALTAAVLARDPDALHAPAHERTEIDLDSNVVTVGDFAMLQGVLENAAELSRHGELLVLPPLPEVVALRNWFCDQAVAQAAGSPPAPWRLRADGPEPEPAPVTWDRTIEPAAGVCWLIGDDRNRIVAASGPASALLGWYEERLVGQRLRAVIPPAYREAHLAAFTRSVVDGGGHILGQPVTLAALRADGSEVPITLTLTRHRASEGRTVYLGVIEP
jgi:PAS domain S-box-containing protein